MTLDRRRATKDRRSAKPAEETERSLAQIEDEKAREREEALLVLGRARLRTASRPARGKRKVSRRRGES